MRGRNTTLTRIHDWTLAKLRRLAEQYRTTMVDLLDIAVDLLEKELRFRPTLALAFQIPLAEAVKPLPAISLKIKGVKYG